MIEWDDSFSVGISIIDEQHKKLINIINDTIALILDKAVDEMQFSKYGESILGILDEMAGYAKEHFATEEAYMLQFGYTEYSHHKEEHFNFFNKVTDYRNKINGDDYQIACEIFEFLKKWIVDHIKVVDKKYMECFKVNGLK